MLPQDWWLWLMMGVGLGGVLCAALMAILEDV